MQYELTEIQKAQLFIFKEFDSLCRKHNLQYFIVGGTVIGAVRHKGFIPWDDDIDVALFRKDYDRFVGIAHKEWDGKRVQIKNYRFTNGFYHSLTHAVDTSVEVVDGERINPVKTNVWIDVNPLDGFPSNEIAREFHYLRLRFIKNLIVLSNFDVLFDLNKKRSKLSNIVASIIKYFNPFKILDTKKLIYRLETVLRIYNADNSAYIGNFLGRYGKKEIMAADIWKEHGVVEFEGMTVPVMWGYDQYLKQLYGDYMQLPPVEKRVNRHAMKVIGGGYRELISLLLSVFRMHIIPLKGGVLDA